MDLTFKTEKGRFNYRVGAVVRYNDKVLIMQDEGAAHYYLPGGRVALSETAQEALARELQEELNVEARVGDLLWLHENFFTFRKTGELFHEVCLYFAASFPEGSTELTMDQWETHDGKRKQRFRWVTTAQVANLDLRPSFLAERLSQSSHGSLHVVTRD